MQLPHGESSRPRILFVDAYDSYSHNIVALLQTELGVDVSIIRIDALTADDDQTLHNLLDGFDAVVCGPGPGNVAVDEDVGVMRRIWHLPAAHVLPVLGICLGFQSLVAESGTRVQQLPQPQHGMIRDICHTAGNVFDGVGDFKAVLYQSWFVDADEVDGDLVPLAWIDADERNPRILVAVQHAARPYTGLQYHPESICTDAHSRRVVVNWFSQAMSWNEENRSRQPPSVSLRALSSPIVPSLLSLAESTGISEATTVNPVADGDSGVGSVGSDVEYEFEALDLPPHISVPHLVEELQNMSSDHVILESSNAHLMGKESGDPANRFSIMALDADDCLRIEYRVHDDFCTCSHPATEEGFVDGKEKIELAAYGGSIWSLLAVFMANREIEGGPDIPFWGGLMGYTTYELGLERLGVLKEKPLERSHSRPDLCFVYVTRSLVIDHWAQKVYVQQLNPASSSDWLKSTAQALNDLFARDTSNTNSLTVPTPISINLPDDTLYEAKVRACQSLIAHGESYELCLTQQSRVTLPLESDEADDIAWPLFNKLRKTQPAPFASFVRLGGATLVSSSPERFLTWDQDGKCEMRPMKGTVKKSAAVSTIEDADRLLRVPKEIAENLMIVDLIRHDMQKVCPAGNVQVPRPMVVQEFATVFTLISIVEGQIAQQSPAAAPVRHTGLDMLAASLPPGSMTGAPKFRSCQLLQGLEDGKERGIYSGVVGYIDVGGRADFSVTIRSMFRYDDERSARDEVWHMGAGGAVTTLSSPLEERKEMQAKLAGPLGILCSGN